MRKMKIYLETTLFNFYFDAERDAHAATVGLFKEIAAGNYEAFTSRYVVDELEKDTTEKREKMLGLIKQFNIPVFDFSEEAEKLADIYVAEGVIPVRYRMDGVHIAISAINDLDMIVSMNFQHIVKRKTKIATANINALNGYRVVEILNPMEVVDNEEP